jgi:hypothetical protein
MDQEAEEILSASCEREHNLVESIRALFDPLGGVELAAYPRWEYPSRNPPSFD